MRNIINWTLGGFFRSIGRILSFIVIGGLLAFLLSKSGLRLPTWLTPMYIVKADTITSWTTQQARVQTTHDGTDSWTNWSNINGDNAVIFSSLSNPVKAISWRVKTNNGMSNLNVYSFRFSYKPTPDAIHPSSYYMQNDTTGEQEEITCTITRNESSGYYWYDCSFQPQTSYTSSDYLYIKINFTLSYLTEMRMSMRGYDERKGTNAVITEQTNNIITNNEQNTQDIINSITTANNELINYIQEGNTICHYIDKNYIVEDNKQLKNDGTLLNNNLSGVTSYINIQQAKITELEVYAEGYLNRFCFYDVNKNFISCQDNAQINDITVPANAVYFRSTIVKSANKPKYLICQNSNQNMENLLTDTDTTKDSNDAANFFHNFNLSLEGPVSQIVLLPLNVLQYLIVDYNSTDVHPPLCTTLKGQEVCLPSGDLIWKRSGCHDGVMSPFGCPNFARFKSFMQLVVGGFIYYKLLRRLVKAVEKGLDPQESGVNLMKL